MLPRSDTVYTRPAPNATAVSVTTPASAALGRRFKSYDPGSTAVNAPAALYATAAPTGASAAVAVFFANNVSPFAFELAFTKRTYAFAKSNAGSGSSTTNASIFLLVAS